MLETRVSRRVLSVLAGLLVSLPPAPVAAQAPADAPQAFGVGDVRPAVKPKPQPVVLPSLRYELDMGAVGRVELPPLDHELLFAEDGAASREQRVIRYGKRRDVDVPLSAGTWSHVPPNVFHWSVDIHSPDALGLRLRLNMTLPERSFLVVYSPDDPTRVHGPYGGAGPFKTGQVWTPTTFGDTVRVEFLMAGDAPPSDGMAPFIIDRLQHVYREPFADDEGLYSEGPCHNDVTCYAGWANTAKAVGGTGYISNDALWCTGQLITAQNGDLTPYFLTANHCIGNQSTAQSVEVYWNYQSTVCNGSPPALASVPQSAVTTLLVTQPGIGTSDHTLLMIEGALPNGLQWAGWNAGAVSNGTDVTGVHHPDGAYKRISFGDKIFISDPDLVQVGWFDGPTEPGSSGSGLFLTSNQQLIGTLSTGSSACGATGSGWPDQYGAFSVAYPSMSALLTGGSDDGFENNDSCGAAAAVGDGTETGLVVKGNDDDWYSLTVPAGNQLNVSLGFTHAYGDIDMKLFNACGGSQLAISESATNNESLSWTNTTGAAITVRLQVYLYSDTRNEYSLTVGGTTGGGGPDCPGTGDCCADNGTPGCADGSCCQAVCACDPFCCDTEWDEFCAGNGFQGSGCGAAVLCASCSALPNDDCANAIVVQNGTFAFDTNGATTDGPAEPSLCNSFNDNQVGSDIWYRYVATCNGNATVSLCSSSYDTKVAIYAGASCPGSSSAMACNDDACGGGQNLQSRIVFPVTAGSSYLVRIGGYNGAQGTGSMNISCDGGGSSNCQPDLGFGGPGNATLTVCGDTGSGGTATFSLTGGPPNVPAYLVYSLSSSGVPFGGGTLVPFPNYFTLPFNTTGAGAVSFDINGGGGPLVVNCQFAIKATPSTWWLSNAVAVTLEP